MGVMIERCLGIKSWLLNRETREGRVMSFELKGMYKVGVLRRRGEKKERRVNKSRQKQARKPQPVLYGNFLLFSSHWPGHGLQVGWWAGELPGLFSCLCAVPKCGSAITDTELPRFAGAGVN